MAAAASLSRRKLLEMLLLIPCSALLGCSSKNLFKRERVCVHVYRPQQFVPKPLLELSGGLVPKRKEELFSIGIPELIVCSFSHSLVETFQYVWPLTEDEFRTFEQSMVIEWAVDKIKGAEDIAKFRDHFQASGGPKRSASGNKIVAFTLNAYTQYWIPEVASICCESGADELVVFKDPTVSPYLCDHPSLQKGFKREPP